MLRGTAITEQHEIVHMSSCWKQKAAKFLRFCWFHARILCEYVNVIVLQRSMSHNALGSWKPAAQTEVSGDVSETNGIE